jgi:hypothetical protein
MFRLIQHLCDTHHGWAAILLAFGWLVVGTSCAVWLLACADACLTTKARR